VIGGVHRHRERENHVKVKGNQEIKGREIIKGERGRNIKRGARKTNRKSQVEGEVASVGNSKSKRGRKVIGAITSPRVRLKGGEGSRSRPKMVRKS